MHRYRKRWESWYRLGAPFLQISPQTISGANERALVIAEAGANRNGDLSSARPLIDIAADSSVDAVKFQTLSASAVVIGRGAMAPYPPEVGAGTSQRSMLERLGIPCHGMGRTAQAEAVKWLLPVCLALLSDG